MYVLVGGYSKVRWVEGIVVDCRLENRALLFKDVILCCLFKTWSDKTLSIRWCRVRSLQEIDYGSLLMVGMMARPLFGTSLHVPLMLIERCQNANFCIFNDPPDVLRQLLLC